MARMKISNNSTHFITRFHSKDLRWTKREDRKREKESRKKSVIELIRIYKDLTCHKRPKGNAFKKISLGKLLG